MALTPGSTPFSRAIPDQTSISLISASVVSVVDGDTLDARIEGQVYRIRLIGVDTPEVFGNVDCFGREASNFTKANLTTGLNVLLEKGVSETDRYDRLLRYLYLPDGRMFNETLVGEGYAQVATFPPDVKYQQRFLAVHRTAANAGKGLWSACVRQNKPSNDSGSTPAPSGSCDPSYPTVCIPPYPPDLDCGQIPYKRFAVRPPDPHRFDGDADGIGCEN